MQINIFICYRRKDSQWFVGRLVDALDRQSKVQLDTVFVDVKEIISGEDFRTIITNAINSSDLMLIIIGKRFLTELEEDGKKRELFGTDDVVRYEIEYALRKKKHIIPILIDGMEIPSKNELPEELWNIAERQAATFRYKNWKEDFQKFLDEISVFSKKLADQQKNKAILKTIDSCSAELFDRRDGKTYKVTKFVNRWWTVENLAYQCDNSFPYTGDAKNIEALGRLYNWKAALEACPEGWRLPTALEWKELISHCRKTAGDSEKRQDETFILFEEEKGPKLKLGGTLNSNKVVRNFSEYGEYWGLSENGKDYSCYVRFLKNGYVEWDKSDINNTNCRSVRLVKDE